MSKRLKIRELALNKLPYGKYNWIVTIQQDGEIGVMGDSNGLKILPLREILNNAGSGTWRFGYIENWKKNKVYDKIYLTHSMDVAMLKLCHSDLIRKIYKIKICGI
jgi:hypothetical protein